MINEPFTQADASITRQYGGSGLGLTISKRLTEMMGGSIGAISTEGKGSTFWFTVAMEKQGQVLPIGGSEVGEGAVNVVESGTSTHTLTLGDSIHPVAANGIRILLTDDDTSALEIVTRLLKNYGYRVDVACCGREALQALETNDYALVLMDCMMPEMNGYEVTAVIRDPASAVRRHDIPVIALTGNAMKQDRDLCIAAGMDDHLPKPLVLKNLLAKLDLWLKGAGGKPSAAVPTEKA